jgi:uncharacterized protein (DUF1810 family)
VGFLRGLSLSSSPRHGRDAARRQSLPAVTTSIVRSSLLDVSEHFFLYQNQPGLYDFRQFKACQDAVYDVIVLDLCNGSRTGSWSATWIFPMLRSADDSPSSYNQGGILNPGHARAYFAHEALGTRLLECVGLGCDVPSTLYRNLGTAGLERFHACITLFAYCLDFEHIAPFKAALAKFFEGEAHTKTLSQLAPNIETSIL